MDDRRADDFLVERGAAAAEIEIECLVLEAAIGPEQFDGLLVDGILVVLLLSFGIETAASVAGFERRDRLSEAIGRLMMNSSMMNPSANGDLFQKIRPRGGVLLGRLGVRVDAELDDEPLALAMPVVDHRLRQLEGGGHKQSRGVRQDVLFEEVHVVMAERLDGRIEAQPAVDEVGDGLDDEPADPGRPLAGDANVVLPLFDVTDALGRSGVSPHDD